MSNDDKALSDAAPLSPEDKTPAAGLQGYFDELLSCSASLNMVGGTDYKEDVQPEPAPLADAAPEREVRKYLDTSRPHWAQARFDAIVLRSGQHHFVVPLQELLSVALLRPEDAAKLQGAGVMITGQWQGQAIPIAHIARLLLLEDYCEDPNAGLSYLLLLKERALGFAVESVSDRLSVDPDAVHWQMDRGNQPWVAGALFETHYPLLDLRQLLPVLERMAPSQ